MSITISNDPTQALSALLQLSKRARMAASLPELGFVIVNETRQLLVYRQSLIWLQQGKLASVSGLPEPERNTPYSLWLNQVAPYWLKHEQAQLIDAQDLPDALASEWDQWLPNAVLLVPFKQENEVFALWLLARDEPWHEAELALASELADSYAHAWRLFLPKITLRQKIRAWLKQRKYKKRFALLVLLVALFPVRLTVLAPAEVVAQDAFLVRAPLDGVVDRFLVQPNALVTQNQPLFELDTTGLRMRLDVAKQAHAAAIEEYRQVAQLALSDDPKSKLEMAERKAQMEAKALELKYSQQLLNRVQVKAPRSGIAVFSDVNDWQGKAVSIGERVLQIADPDKVEINLRLPVNDAIPLDKQAEVRLYLTTAPQYTYDARLSYSAYRSELGADDRVAYKLKAQFEPNQALPRIGLTGTAKVYGDRVPLIYYILRRPLATMRQYLGW